MKAAPSLLHLLTCFALLPAVGALVISRHEVAKRPFPSSRNLSIRNDNDIVMPDYLIVDSESLAHRPSLAAFLHRPRERVALPLMMIATAVSLSNIMGNYGDSYLALQAISVVLGLVNAFVDLQASLPPYDNPPAQGVSPNIRSGVVDDALLNVYSGVYTGCVSWLALRTSLFCPTELPIFDQVLGLPALGIFIFSLAAPSFTLMHHYTGLLGGSLQTMVGLARQTDPQAMILPPLSDTEIVRTRGLLAIGMIGCIYSPEVISFLTLGQDWWARVGETFPGQPVIESSTALFGIFATQASMISHRAGKAGVASFSFIVPAFAVVCLLLAVLPCVAAFYWLGDDISFVEFYSL